MDRFQYLALMAMCLAVTLPLELVLGARVYRRPGRMLRAVVPAVVVFAAWDAIAIARGQWWFVERYLTGWDVPFRIPVEEIVFFVVVPLCGLLTYEVVGRGLDRARRRA
ncbi:MAG TPA: lycopene cyclase domain-containing protein [Acidimicrobiia bacterium]|jgi:lycopene cyclase domain-containing protein